MVDNGASEKCCVKHPDSPGQWCGLCKSVQYFTVIMIQKYYYTLVLVYSLRYTFTVIVKCYDTPVLVTRL